MEYVNLTTHTVEDIRLRYTSTIDRLTLAIVHSVREGTAPQNLQAQILEMVEASEWIRWIHNAKAVPLISDKDPMCNASQFEKDGLSFEHGMPWCSLATFSMRADLVAALASHGITPSSPYGGLATWVRKAQAAGVYPDAVMTAALDAGLAYELSAAIESGTWQAFAKRNNNIYYASLHAALDGLDADPMRVELDGLAGLGLPRFYRIHSFGQYACPRVDLVEAQSEKEALASFARDFPEQREPRAVRIGYR